MAEPFMGEIKIWGLSFAPRNWAYCNGTFLSISQYSALFSLLGTQFGGNGTTTFALPDFRGRAPVHPGQDVPRTGIIGGAEYITLSEQEMPNHSHSLNVSTATDTTVSPSNALPAQSDNPIYANANNLNPMNASSIDAAGQGQPHYNIQPSLVLNFCIALSGLYPSRN